MSKQIDLDILICLNCKNNQFKKNLSKITCQKCQKKYPYKDDKYFFSVPKNDIITDPLDKLKHFLKRYSLLYEGLIAIISPVYTDNTLRHFINLHVKNKNIMALNLGSGNSNYKNISNIDIINYPNVNLICDITNLPIKNESIDIIINRAVLEHIPNDQKAVSEMFRILKKGGFIICFYPFIQGFHASPKDYTRKTYEGVKELFKNLELIELKCYGGPTSGLLWVFQEWLAILLSFGIRQLHDLIYLLIIIITFPIKYLDIILIHHPLAKNISSGFIIIGRKI
ncbi:methyltransferase domain-containing protein [Patescibacteria group bacterium]|nr:methyltransferase domain-containing protein [Patescibacteria group bacterium]MBU4016305.1 methyltransferase domain-containing protein [Patescibacteria group bacterium]MBU4098532.1 methyltransferase domain-containing protein [Patescibacteria group bacterium]